jgi:hypothetical protein
MQQQRFVISMFTYNVIFNACIDWKRSDGQGKES